MIIRPHKLGILCTFWAIMLLVFSEGDPVTSILAVMGGIMALMLTWLTTDPKDPR